MKTSSEGIRVDSNSCFYFNICRDNYKKFAECLRGLSAIEDNITKTQERLNLRIKQDKCGVTVRVFAAMCLEAFIYDYATTKLSDSFIRNYLDKLDLVSKWVVVPQLITNKRFNTDSQAFEHFKKLVKDRNKLVHPKSFFLPEKDYNAHIENIGKAGEEELLAAHNAYKSIKEMFSELRKIDSNVTKATQWAFVE